jgi:hypothetical protein
MRVSVYQSDPGYNLAHFGAKVFFEGSEISRVITADEENRFVVVVCTDEKGDVMLTPDRTEVKTETRYGAVRIELPTAKETTA